MDDIYIILSFAIKSNENKGVINYLESIKDNVVNWEHLSISHKLSESFIEKFQDNFDWDYITQYQKLSESFIKKFQDKINWLIISIQKRIVTYDILNSYNMHDKHKKEFEELYTKNGKPTLKDLVNNDNITAGFLIEIYHNIFMIEEF